MVVQRIKEEKTNVGFDAEGVIYDLVPETS